MCYFQGCSNRLYILKYFVYSRRYTFKCYFLKDIVCSERYNFTRYYTYIYVNGIRNKMWIPLTTCGYNLQFADSIYSLRVPLTVPQQLNSTIYMSLYLFVDSTNCFWFRKYGCRFRNFAYFWSDFERYSVLGICLWNPK